jgi:hypothetical protein
VRIQIIHHDKRNLSHYDMLAQNTRSRVWHEMEWLNRPRSCTRSRQITVIFCPQAKFTSKHFSVWVLNKSQLLHANRASNISRCWNETEAMMSPQNVRHSPPHLPHHQLIIFILWVSQFKACFPSLVKLGIRDCRTGCLWHATSKQLQH